MSLLLLLAIIPPFIWAINNHGDKYSIDRFARGRNPASLLLFTAIAAGIFALGIFCFGRLAPVTFVQALVMTASGLILILAYIPYMHALEIDETSNTTPLFQLVTPFVYLFGLVFLGEHLPFLKLCAGSLIFIGAIVLSFDFKHFRIRRKTLLLVMLASVMIASNTIMFKFFGVQTNFWTTSLFETVGVALGGVIFWCIPAYRRNFVAVIREYRYRVVGLSMAIEASGLFARLLFGFITLAFPVILVQFVAGLQPLFIILIGIVLTKWAPHLGEEAVDRHSLVRKFSAILIMLLGLVLLVS